MRNLSPRIKNLILTMHPRLILILSTVSIACMYYVNPMQIEYSTPITQAPFSGFDLETRLRLLIQLGNQFATNTRPPIKKKGSLLTFCTMVKNETKYVREWIEFHSLLGVDKFYIFDNHSPDSLESTLNDTIADVSIIKWPPQRWLGENPHKESCESFFGKKNMEEWAMGYCQIAAFHECIQRESGNSRWLGNVDIDEFFMPMYDESGLRLLPDALNQYPFSYMHGVRLNSFTYGTGHHQTAIADNELIVETHILRGSGLNSHKEIVDPSKVITYHTVHHAIYKNPLWNLGFLQNFPRGSTVIRFNHYPFRSVDEARLKGLKNMNPNIFAIIKQWDLVHIEDPYMVPMAPLIKRRMRGEDVWIKTNNFE